MQFFQQILRKLNETNGVSFIKLAKEAFKCNKEEIGIKFLEKEKSIVTKIPQYVELKRWESAINLTLETHDSNMMIAVLDKLMKTENIDSFITIVSKHKNAYTQIVEFLRTYHPELVEKFLKDNNLFEDLLFLYLENYFLSSNIKEKTIYLENAKTAHRQLLDKDKEEWKFYTTYLQDLENSIYFKKDIINENYIKNTDTGGFDRPVIAFYNELIFNDKYGYVEAKNKQFFDVNPTKLIIIRMKVYAESKNIDAIKLLNINLKQTNSCYIAFAEICMDNKLNDLVVEFIRKTTNEEESLVHKYNMLKHVEKYDAALELVISNEDCDKQVQYVNEILNKDSSLQDKVKEYCIKYKVDLS